jgi:hypothetical protein
VSHCFERPDWRMHARGPTGTRWLLVQIKLADCSVVSYCRSAAYLKGFAGAGFEPATFGL